MSPRAEKPARLATILWKKTSSLSLLLFLTTCLLVGLKQRLQAEPTFGRAVDTRERLVSTDGDLGEQIGSDGSKEGSGVAEQSVNTGDVSVLCSATDGEVHDLALATPAVCGSGSGQGESKPKGSCEG